MIATELSFECPTFLVVFTITTPYWDSKKSNPTIWCSCASRFEFSQKLFCSVLLRTKSNVLFSQRIRSNILCFFAPIQNVLSSQGIKSNIMCFFAPIQICSKIRSNVLLCTKYRFSVFSLQIKFTKLYHSLPILSKDI